MSDFGPGTVTWIDLSSDDLEGSKSFYANLFGWEPFPVPDSPSGGQTVFLLHGKQVGALRRAEPGHRPLSMWSPYFATDDAGVMARTVRVAGGRIVREPYDVMDQGRMAVFQDPTGAYFFAWERGLHPGFEASDEPGSYTWAELNTRGIVRARAFYQRVFGWRMRISPIDLRRAEYTEFSLDGSSISGAVEMPHRRQAVPHWLLYFGTFEIDASTKKVSELGGTVLAEPTDFPGGRFSVVSDLLGAAFGLLETKR